TVQTAPSGLPGMAEQADQPEPAPRRWFFFGRWFRRNSTKTTPAPVGAATTTEGDGTTVMTPATVVPATGDRSAGRIVPVATETPASAARVQSKVRAACGARAGDVHVTRQADGTLVVRVRLSDPRTQDEAIQKIMQLPEMSGPNVRLEVEVG